MEYSQKTLGQFKLDYLHHGKFNLKVQVPHLARLAEFYVQKYKASHNWTDCIKAHALYNSISTRKPQFLGWKKKVFRVQELYCNDHSSLSFQQQQKLTGRLKARLREIRTQTLSDMQAADALVKKFDSQCTTEELYVNFFNCLRSVSINCSQAMAEFAGEIIQECVDVLKPTKPPCDFIVVAIGSLARGEATPYSDLEYFFLVKEKSLEIIGYFERLAIISYIQICNLGETKLSHMSIKELNGWFDDQAKNGFKIDGLSEKAGNIPTGNGSPCTRNQFIVTPQILAKRYGMIFGNPKRETALRGDLTAMLTYMKPVYTHKTEDKDLLTELKSLIQCHSMNQMRRQINLEMLKTDITKFNFKPDMKLMDRGFSTDVKREIFRFPSILLLDITILMQTVSCTSWESITALREKKKISLQFHSVLQLLLAAATYMRLSTYLHHDSQDERMSVTHEITRSESSNVQKSQHRWFVHSGLFVTMCSKMSLLKSKLADNVNIAKDLESLALHVDDDTEFWLRIPPLYHTGRYIDIIHSLKQRYGELRLGCFFSLARNNASEWDQFETLYMISCSMFRCGEYRDALVMFQNMQMSGIGFPSLTGRIADCYIWLRDYDQALTVLESATERSVEILYSLGALYFAKKELEKSEQVYIQALEMFCSEVSTEKQYDYYGDPIETDEQTEMQKFSSWTITSPEERLCRIVSSSPNIIVCLNALGAVYYQQGRYHLAESYFNKTISLISELYGEGAAVYIACATFNNLGSTYRKMGRYEEAVNYLKKAIAVLDKLFHDDDNIEKGHTLDNLGLSYNNMGQYNRAHNYFVKALTIYDKLSCSGDTKPFTHATMSKVMKNEQRQLIPE